MSHSSVERYKSNLMFEKTILPLIDIFLHLSVIRLSFLPPSLLTLSQLSYSISLINKHLQSRSHTDVRPDISSIVEIPSMSGISDSGIPNSQPPYQTKVRPDISFNTPTHPDIS